MITMLDPLATELETQLVIAHAADAGFRLVSHETDAGQVVWEWRRGAEPRPQFVTRRVAVHWMGQFLEREGAVAFVSEVGQSMA